MTKDEILQTIYNQEPITEEQLKKMLQQTLHTLRNEDLLFELPIEEESSSESE